VTEWAYGVMKHDTRTGETEVFADGADYFGEPAFVPDPDGAREDDGVVLTVGLDAGGGTGSSRLFVLDGRTLEERARTTLPHTVPFDFHGRYFPELKAKRAG
jgi:beta-carotene 15,15'-monooxygenase